MVWIKTHNRKRVIGLGEIYAVPYELQDLCQGNIRSTSGVRNGSGKTIVNDSLLLEQSKTNNLGMRHKVTLG